MITLIYFLLQNALTIVGYEISDAKMCDIVVSKNRGTMVKFYAANMDSKCKGLVRFKQHDDKTYCIPIIDGKNDILHCPVSSLRIKVILKILDCYSISRP